ncbi:NUDIX domain-containing protein [Nocardioides sp. JQ2195]|uniref:NUDIX hydrolase n=1 Tax=Nocardioides sp. JQ2195 TaxID=2592334 RepID=UPI00143E4972|nr:NUDIX domain-containing protein [Nocardioides sp. JQ2195]QIX26660.1 NUDIX domain-containing protein [Nocardioides sp. JQ2195]
MAPGVRVAVRIVLLDPHGRVLLFEGRDLSDPDDAVRFWFTAGGGVDEDETLEQAAHRELLEETGMTGLQLAGPFHRREVDFLNHGTPLRQVEHFFAARTMDTSLEDRAWTELELEAMTTWRWWSTDELMRAGIVHFPEELVDLVHRADSLV